jgi:hypothetical protein
MEKVINVVVESVKRELAKRGKLRVKVSSSIEEVFSLDDQSALDVRGLLSESAGKREVWLIGTKEALLKFAEECENTQVGGFDWPAWYYRTAKKTAEKIRKAV